MNNIVPVEKLAQMPITKEFAELLFGEDDIDLSKIKWDKTYFGKEYAWIRYGFEDYFFAADGSIDYQLTSQSEELPNAFQIVRYIDNYINSLK